MYMGILSLYCQFYYVYYHLIFIYLLIFDICNNFKGQDGYNTLECFLRCLILQLQFRYYLRSLLISSLFSHLIGFLTVRYNLDTYTYVTVSSFQFPVFSFQFQFSVFSFNFQFSLFTFQFSLFSFHFPVPGFQFPVSNSQVPSFQFLVSSSQVPSFQFPVFFPLSPFKILITPYYSGIYFTLHFISLKPDYILG